MARLFLGQRYGLLQSLHFLVLVFWINCAEEVMVRGKLPGSPVKIFMRVFVYVH